MLYLRLFVLFCCLSFASASAETLKVVSSLDKPFGDTHPELTDRLDIAGSRGEALSFFLRLPAGTACDWPKISLQGEKNSEHVPGRAVFSYLPYIDIKHPSFPNAPIGKQLDPVLPLAGQSICLTKNGKSWLYGEYYIDRQALPDVYKGTITFKSLSIPVTLTVWKMVMPETPTYPIYTEMTTWWNLLGHYGKWTEDEARLSKTYLRMLRAHRVETLTTAIDVPKIDRSKLKHVLELRNSPTSEQSFTEMNMKGRFQGAHLGFPTIPQEEIGSTQSREYLRALENTIPTLPKDKTPMLYTWDEPQLEDHPKLITLLQDIRSAAPSVKTMVTTVYDRKFHDLIDIYAPVADEIGGRFPSIDRYRALQREGKEFWWYVSCMSHGCEALADSGVPDLVIDRPSVYIRSIGWIGKLLKTDAFLYYHVNQAFQYYPKRDPWRDQWDFSGNGDGTLMYPGRPGMYHLKEHQPVASLRLKLLRETSYDVEYISWIESQKEKPSWWPAAKKQLVGDFRKWSRDYKAYDKVRRRIGDYLNGG